MMQALAGEPMTVHGDGSQTRSLCYVDDTVEGMVRLLYRTGATDPVNIGNPEEVTVLKIAELIRRLVGGASEVVFTGRPIDDPERRRPDIARARSLLGWEPRVSLEEGLRRTLAWCRSAWALWPADVGTDLSR
jgi:nucleoside-diphosphate-sugar epimerase